MLAACSEDITVKLFDISELPAETPKLIQALQAAHTAGIISLSFSSDDLLLASAGRDKDLIVYFFSEKNKINNN